MSKNMKYTDVRQIVYKRGKGKCAICGEQLTLEEMCVGLIVPRSKGGGKDFANLQCTCDSCTKMKHDLTWDEFMKKLWKVTAHNFWNILKTYLEGALSNEIR